MNINMKSIFGIYMKISYFCHISLNIGRSDMKQKAKNPLRSMLSYPFTLFWILAHTFFFFGVTIFLVLPSFHLHSVLLCYPSYHQALLTTIFFPFFTGLYYPSCTAWWAILFIHFYRGGLSYSSIFTVVGYLIHPFLPWWVILFIHFYRGGLSYSSIFTVVGYLIHILTTYMVLTGPCIYRHFVFSD